MVLRGMLDVCARTADGTNDAPDALAARAVGAFRAAGWRQEADGAWVSAEGAGAGAAVDQSDSGVGTRAGPNVSAASDYLAFAGLAILFWLRYRFSSNGY